MFTFWIYEIWTPNESRGLLGLEIECSGKKRRNSMNLPTFECNVQISYALVAVLRKPLFVEISKIISFISLFWFEITPIKPLSILRKYSFCKYRVKLVQIEVYGEKLFLILLMINCLRHNNRCADSIICKMCANA